VLVRWLGPIEWNARVGRAHADSAAASAYAATADTLAVSKATANAMKAFAFALASLVAAAPYPVLAGDSVSPTIAITSDGHPQNIDIYNLLPPTTPHGSVVQITETY
jgi:hypothetical protein